MFKILEKTLKAGIVTTPYPNGEANISVFGRGPNSTCRIGETPDPRRMPVHRGRLRSPTAAPRGA